MFILMFFIKLEKFSATISSAILTCPFLSSFGTPMRVCWYTWWCPTDPLVSVHLYSIFFFFLIFRFDNFCTPIFKFANSSFGLLKSVFECPLWILRLPRWLSDKNLPANAGDMRDAGLTPGLKRSPGVGNAAHSSVHDWKTPWTEEPGWLQSMGSQRVGCNWACTVNF